MLPDALFNPGQDAIFIGHTGSLRYDLFKGKMSLDDSYIVSPFKDVFYMAASIPGATAAAVIKELIVKGKRDPLRDRSSAVTALPPWVSSMDAADVCPSLQPPHHKIHLSISDPVRSVSLQCPGFEVAPSTHCARECNAVSEGTLGKLMFPLQIDVKATYDVITVSFDVPTIVSALKKQGAPPGTTMDPFKQGIADDRSVWETYAKDTWPCKKA